MPTYDATIETPSGLLSVECTDANIDALPPDSLARVLRDDYRAGVAVTPAEIAQQFYRETH